MMVSGVRMVPKAWLHSFLVQGGWWLNSFLDFLVLFWFGFLVSSSQKFTETVSTFTKNQETGLFPKMQPNFRMCRVHQTGCLKESYFFRVG